MFVVVITDEDENPMPSCSSAQLADAILLEDAFASAIAELEAGG